MLGVRTRPPIPIVTARGHRRQERVSWWLAYLACIGGTLVVGALAVYRSPRGFSLAALLLLMLIGFAIVRPVAALYPIVFLSLVGDPGITQWYPFFATLSNRDSVLYLSHQFLMSPLELCIGALYAGWVLRMLTLHRWELRRGRLFWPLMVFSGFVVLSLGYSLARHGVFNVALWEARPLIYIPLLYVLFSNLVERAEQYTRLYWCVMAAVCINGLVAVRYLHTLSPEARDSLESLVAHPATLPMNAMFVMVIAAWLFRPSSSATRWLLPVMAVPVLIAYLVSQRRGAVVGLVAAMVVIAMLLWVTKRRTFWAVVPIATILAIGYVGAFWHSESSLATPALAVKSVIAPNELDQKDFQSSQYREIENADLVYTIRSHKLLGVGFGHEFLKPIPLPAINAYLLKDYVPHNNILWIWLKTGVGGFVAMLFLFALTMRTGARASIATIGTPAAVITVTSVCYIVSYLVFAYVDYAWDPQNMVLLAMALAEIDWAARWALDHVPDTAFTPLDAGGRNQRLSHGL
jgi:hypothetical protein